jgi:hypothetical protein
MSRQEYIDKYLSKWASRKLVVFSIGSIGLFTGFLQSGDWVVIATAYISIEGVTSIVTEIYKSRN